jgi:hypothetical protein
MCKKDIFLSQSSQRNLEWQVMPVRGAVRCGLRIESLVNYNNEREMQGQPICLQEIFIFKREEK